MAIKKIVYTGGSDNLHAKQKKAMAHVSFMDLQQEKFQDIRNLGTSTWPQWKLCTELGLRFSCSEDDTTAVLASPKKGKSKSKKVKCYRCKKDGHYSNDQ